MNFKIHDTATDNVSGVHGLCGQPAPAPFRERSEERDVPIKLSDIAENFRESARKEEFRGNYTIELSTELAKQIADTLDSVPGRSLNFYSRLCHNLSVEAGWWGGLYERARPLDFPLAKAAIEAIRATKLALVHSEISEALEGLRKGIPDDHLPARSMFEVELADALIRIFDLAGESELDLEGAVMEKLRYNASRADHRPENRAAEGGKKF